MRYYDLNHFRSNEEVIPLQGRNSFIIETLNKVQVKGENSKKSMHFRIKNSLSPSGP